MICAVNISEIPLVVLFFCPEGRTRFSIVVISMPFYIYHHGLQAELICFRASSLFLICVRVKNANDYLATKQIIEIPSSAKGIYYIVENR